MLRAKRAGATWGLIPRHDERTAKIAPGVGDCITCVLLAGGISFKKSPPFLVHASAGEGWFWYFRSDRANTFAVAIPLPLFFDSSFGCECGANLVDDLGGRVGRHESGVADAVKTLGQNVLDVSEKEHLGCHFCRSMSPDGIDFWLRGISPEGDGHLLVAQAEDAAIRDGDSVGVPCEVTDNNVGPTVGFSREHHPFLGDFLAKIKKPGIAAVFWRERHVACIHELPQPVEKSSAEGSGKSPDTEEKISLAFAPDFLLGVPGTGRDEGMNVGMKAEILCPTYVIITAG